MNARSLATFLSSNWALGTTQTGGRNRRFVFILVGAFLWALFAAFHTPPPWDAAVSQQLFFYILGALFHLAVFPIFLVLAVFFALVFFVSPRYAPEFSKPRLRWIMWFTATFLGGLWAIRAYQVLRPELAPDFPGQFLAYPFQALFSPWIFRHVLIVALALWVAYRVAATYLEDIYELDNFSIAERYILQSTLASGYNVIRIRDAAIAAEDRDSPIARIGGPGLVRVFLENAAIAEKADGASRVIGPTEMRARGVEPLAAFERIRAEIDLRDLIDDLDVESRTSDGIVVRAEEVHIVYSVYRGNQPSTQELPYPYDIDALLRLFYSRGSEIVKVVMSGMIRSELAKFISRHTLGEFLAAVSMDELKDIQRQLAQQQDPRAQALFPVPDFVTRPQLVTELFAAEFAKQAQQGGVELKWIGVGTWVLPDEIFHRRHQEAWRLTLENLIRGSDRELERVSLESEALEFLRLVQEVPLMTFRRHQDLPPLERMRRIIIAYHGRLNEAYQALERDGRLPVERERLRRVLVFLARFTTRRLRGPSATPTQAAAPNPPGSGPGSGGPSATPTPPFAPKPPGSGPGSGGSRRET